MARGLSDAFMNDLLNGDLITLLEFVKNDHTLDFEIITNYADIYYRGGRILGVHPKKAGYTFKFDQKYLNSLPSSSTINKSRIESYKNAQDWENYFASTKQVMDMFFISKSKLEREFQQLVVRENNYSSISNGTDYFIIDIEYDNRKGAKFDIVALEWESKGTARKLTSNYKPKLVVIEMKYGDGAISGNSGIHKHINDFNTFKQNQSDVSAFKSEMMEVFNQKRKLGLVHFSKAGNSNEVKSVQNDIEFALLIANHDPDSTKLIDIVKNSICANTRFFMSSFMGYGLHKKYLLDHPTFMARLWNEKHALQNT